MNAIVITGLLSGLAAALLFAAIAAGNPIGILLFYFASLPLLIAGIGWGWLTAVVGAAIGGIAVAIGTGGETALAFLATVGLPAAWLSYLALLARTDEDGTTQEWYPIGRLLLWAAGIGAVLGVVTFVMINQQSEAIRAGFTELLRAMAPAPPNGQPPMTDEQLAGTANTLVGLMPPISAALWLFVTLLNLYIAARVVRSSQRLQRPWPDLSGVELPGAASLAFGVAVAAALVFGNTSLPGVFAFSVVSVLTIALACVGLGVIHTISRGSGMRTVLLITTYIGLIFFGWPILLFAALGIAETRLRLRDRGRPPTAGST